MRNKNKLSIVHINTYDSSGGAAKAAARLAKAQRDSGHDSKMLVGKKTGDSEHTFSFAKELNRYLYAICQKQGLLYYGYQGSHKLVENRLVRSADILHLHNLHGDYFNPFSLSSLTHLKPTVWTLHDMQSITGHCAHSFDCPGWETGCQQCPNLSTYPGLNIDSSARLYRDKKLIYDNSFLNIVVPSKWLEDKVQRSILRNHPVDLIYNGVDTNIFKPYNKKDARKKFNIPANILAIGAVAHEGTFKNPWKGGNHTQAVFDASKDRLPEHVFVNIGGSSNTNDPGIINIPHINDESRLAQAYSMLDIFLYTPTADNCPLVILEALSCGVPIVTFNTGGIPELVRDGLDGFVTAYEDIPQTARALEKLATQSQLRAEFSRNGRQSAIARFDHKVIARQYQNLYERCLQEHQGKAKEVKLLPLAEVPEIVVNDAFIKAENSKKVLAYNELTNQQNVDSTQAEYDVSIILCTKDRAQLLGQMLASLEKATRGITYEIIVVEGGSSDNTLEILGKHNITKLYSESEYFGPGKHSWPQLYNFGFSKATGKWAMYASDDIIFSENCITNAVKYLQEQEDRVSGGIFFYKNTKPTNREWIDFGIDFAQGNKLMLNYGLIRLDHFREVDGLDEQYKFYCADTDFCYKLYESKKKLIPLPESFVIHNNILDVQKARHCYDFNRDIRILLLQKWAHFVPTDLPNPRRLMWDEKFFDAFKLPAEMQKLDPGIENYWHGLAYFQKGLFENAKSKFIQTLNSNCDHWMLQWYIAQAAYQCGDKLLAEKMAKNACRFAPASCEIRDFLKQSADYKSGKSIVPLQNYTETASELPVTKNKNTTIGLIFSKDRAMQLQATLESFFLHCIDNGRIKLSVLYKATNQLHRRRYNKLKEKFSNISFIEETDFKQRVLTTVNKSDYVLFLVDDNLFVKDFHLADVVRTLQENKDTIGLSLRLGKNTTYCYSRNTSQALPTFQQLSNGILKYDWTQAEFDFGYPLELSSSVYKTGDILILLDKLEFANPNVLEDKMATNAKAYAEVRPKLCCYESSITFCNPVNKVQSVWDNRSGSEQKYSAERLAEMFDDGIRIDVQKYSNFVPNACHQEVQLYFEKTENKTRQTQTTPGFSIVTANYNNAKYIAHAIDSVLNQTYKNWELIIVEDCSTDNSLEIINKYLEDSRIKLIQHEKNRGYTVALKTAIANIRSEYFGILDSDDCLTRCAVETMRDYHIKFPNCGLIYSQFAYCDEVLTRRRPGFCAPIPPGKTTLDANVVSHFKTFKLRDYLKTPGYDENILYAEDIDIVYKMEEVTKLKFVDECLYLYRELPDSICHSKSKVNIAIMSRAKAGINALNRRSAVLAKSTNQDFDQLFREAVKETRATHRDIDQFLIVLTKLYKNGLLDDLDLPSDIKNRAPEDKLLWLAVNANVNFDKLFNLLADQGKTTEQPLVTVYMAAYNAQKFISRAIESVLLQTYKNFELLIIDDGSTDETKKLTASYSDSRIRYIYKEHKNFASGMNRAIVESRGEYLIGVDSDDFIAPDYIEKMVAFAQNHPQIDYFYPAQLTLVDESGSQTGRKWSYMDFTDNSVLPAFLFDNSYGPIPNPGSLKRKSLFDKVGLYDELDTVEDFVFLCKNALKINFKRVDENPAYFYRRHQQSNSQKLEARNRIMADTLNEMVSIYPPQVLFPQIADIDEPLKQRRYYEYLVKTFCKHAGSSTTGFGHYFQRYADHYKSKLLQIAEQKLLVPTRDK